MIAIRRERCRCIQMLARRLLLLWHAGEKKSLFFLCDGIFKSCGHKFCICALIFLCVAHTPGIHMYKCSSSFYTQTEFTKVKKKSTRCVQTFVMCFSCARWLIVSRNNIPSLFLCIYRRPVCAILSLRLMPWQFSRRVSDLFIESAQVFKENVHWKSARAKRERD